MSTEQAAEARSDCDVVLEEQSVEISASHTLENPPELPSRTLMATATSRGYASICHWREPRAITVAEAKRLHSYPDDFRLVGKYKEQMARIGNSVPPKLMHAIAEHIRDTVLVPARTADAA